PARPDDTVAPGVVVEHLIATIRKWRITARATIQSFDFRGLRRAAELAPEIPRSCLTDAETSNAEWTGHDPSEYGGSVPRLVAAAGCKIWSPDEHTLTAALVGEAPALGPAVLALT